MLREDSLITPTLLRRFELEGQHNDGDGRYYGLIQRDDGSLLVHHPIAPAAAPQQTVWAGKVLRLLNKELHHDGAWVVCFTHALPVRVDNIFLDTKHVEYGRYCLVWIDHDGDPGFTVEWVAGENADFTHFHHVVEAGIESTARKCESSWEIWRLMMQDVLDPKDGQTFKRAKGERAPSAH